MGFDLLGRLARQAGLTNGDLFSDRTLRAIKHGDVHVTRGQWAAYLPADVRAFLQPLTVLYDQTIAHKKGVIQLAMHLGLTFTRYPKTGPLTGVTLQKKQGNKLQYSITFCNKAAEVARVRQGRTLTRLEATTVREQVRFDVTVHSAGVLTLIGEARRRSPQLLLRRPGYLDAKSAQRLLTEASHARPCGCSRGDDWAVALEGVGLRAAQAALGEVQDRHRPALCLLSGPGLLRTQTT